MGQLVLTAGQLPALRELDLNVGLLGYGRLGLGPATCLTRLTVDSVEYVDLRYTEVRAVRHGTATCCTAALGMWTALVRAWLLHALQLSLLTQQLPVCPAAAPPLRHLGELP